MKKALMTVALLAGALVGYNLITTGKLTLIPRAETPEARDLAAIERRVDNLRQELGQAHRAAGLTGTDSTGDVAALTTELSRVSEDLAGLRKRLTDETAKREAEQLAATIRGLREALR